MSQLLAQATIIHFPTSHKLCHPRRPVITCSAKPKPNLIQLTNIEPQVVNPRTINIGTALAQAEVNDHSLQSAWSQRMWFATGCTTELFTLAKALDGANRSHIWVEPILAAFIGYIFADLVTGVYHWMIDNYGDASTPVLGPQLERAQGHHKTPWAIAKRGVANNLHVVARVVAFLLLPLAFTFHENPVVLSFIVVFSTCNMFSQQFHAWAHGTKSKLPRLVVALQEAGLILSPSKHAGHHRAPYNNSYCIVSGVWNDVLDKNKVFERLEKFLYFKFGVRPISWDIEPDSNQSEEADQTGTHGQVTVVEPSNFRNIKSDKFMSIVKSINNV